jgi:hypothetical protein
MAQQDEIRVGIATASPEAGAVMDVIDAVSLAFAEQEAATAAAALTAQNAQAFGEIMATMELQQQEIDQTLTAMGVEVPGVTPQAGMHIGMPGVAEGIAAQTGAAVDQMMATSNQQQAEIDGWLGEQGFDLGGGADQHEHEG